MRIIAGIISLVATVYLYTQGVVAGEYLAIAPWIVPAAGALLGGLGNLFGDDPKQYTMQDLIDMGYTPYDISKERNKILRLEEGRLKSKRNQVSQKASELGMDPIAANYGNEEEVYQQTQGAMSEAEAYDKAEKNRIASMLFQMNAGNEPESGFSKFVGGALQGADIGLGVQSTLSKMESPIDPGATTTTTPSTVPMNAPPPVLDNDENEGDFVSQNFFKKNKKTNGLRGMTGLNDSTYEALKHNNEYSDYDDIKYKLLNLR